MISISCIERIINTADCGVAGDTVLRSGIQFDNGTTKRILLTPVYANFGEDSAYLYDLSGNNYIVNYIDIDKTRSELEELVTNCGCCGEGGGGSGTVTNFSAGDASPLFTTSVANPTTTPSLSFTLPNISQYQVFGSATAGSNPPTWVNLAQVAFTGDYNHLINKPTIPTLLWQRNSGVLAPATISDKVSIGQTTSDGNGLTIRHDAGFSIPIVLRNETYGSTIIQFLSGAASTAYFEAIKTATDSELMIFGGDKVTFRVRYLGGAAIPVAEYRGDGHVYLPNTLTDDSADYLLGVISGTTKVVRRTIASVGSKWTAYATYLAPTLNYNIRTNGGATSEGYIEMTRGTSGLSGFLQIYGPSARIGFIGYFTDRMRYHTDNSAHFHEFAGGAVRIINTTQDNTLTKVMVLDANSEVKWRDSSTLGGGSGTVTSVGMALPSNTFSISGSPVTTSGTLTGSFISQTQHNVLAAPWGFDGTPIWRRLQTSDLAPNGATTGQLIRFDGTDWVAWTPSYTTYTAGTGISISGGVITNTLPSLWTAYSTYLAPTSNFNIRTNGGATSEGYIEMTRGTSGLSGMLQIFAPSVRIGFIGYFTDRLKYYTDNTAHFHEFDGGAVRIINAAQNNSLTKIMVFDANNEVKWRDVTTLAAGNPVWRVQGGTTDATTNTQSIYHNGNVWVGDGSGTTSSYKFHVSGTSYFTSTIDTNNNVSIRSLNAAGSAFRTIAVYDTSNIFRFANDYFRVVGEGAGAGNITIPSYTNTRDDSSTTNPENLLYTSSSGALLSAPGELFRNDGATAAISSNETNHLPDNTYRVVTFDNVNKHSFSQYGADTTAGNQKILLPASGIVPQYHVVFVTIQFNSTIALAVDIQVRRNTTAIETYTHGASIGRNVITIHVPVFTYTAADPINLALRFEVAASGTITLERARVTVIPLGAPPPV